MFKKFFDKKNEENFNNKNILIAALLIHAAKIDDNYTDVEKEIIKTEAGIDDSTASSLATIGEKIRNLTDYGLTEAASPRVLIYAGRLIKEGIPPRRACQVAITWGITDDKKLHSSIEEVISAIFP